MQLRPRRTGLPDSLFRAPPVGRAGPPEHESPRELARYGRQRGHFSWYEGRSLHEISTANLREWIVRWFSGKPARPRLASAEDSGPVEAGALELGAELKALRLAVRSVVPRVVEMLLVGRFETPMKLGESWSRKIALASSSVSEVSSGFRLQRRVFGLTARSFARWRPMRMPRSSAIAMSLVVSQGGCLSQLKMTDFSRHRDGRSLGRYSKRARNKDAIGRTPARNWSLSGP